MSEDGGNWRGSHTRKISRREGLCVYDRIVLQVRSLLRRLVKEAEKSPSAHIAIS